jgi:hypothetical protein
MANWQRTVRLNPEWGQAQEGEITYQALAASIVKKLRLLRPFKAELDDINEGLDEIVTEFECLAESADTNVSDIDCVMHDFYDWGDIRLDGDWNGKKVCFIDTFALPSKDRQITEQV